MQAAGAAAVAGALPRAGVASGLRSFTLRAQAATVPVVGDPYPATAVWSYGGDVPGPALRIRQGERLRVALENALDAPTTVHWHGVRLPNAMDGVPGLTQEPVPPGGRFVYEFTPPDAGTFWYHPHVRAFEQVERGLAGVLVVEEREPVPVDRDVTWVLDDWRLTREAAIREDFGAGHDVSHAGRIGNTVTINGRRAQRFAVRQGERIRLRLVNVSNARAFALSFEGHEPLVIALDGQPVKPYAPDGGVVVLGAATRVDLLLDCRTAPGTTTRVVDDFYPRFAYDLVELACTERLERSVASDAHVAIRSENRLPEPDLERATRHMVTLTGGAMGGMRGAELDGEWTDIRTLVRSGLVWAMNGVARRPTDYEPPMIVAPRGSSHLVTLRNESAFPHPMHLHGHHFRVLARGGAATAHREWRDTVLVMPRESVDVAFKADNPGDWLFHCHVLEHHAGGMSAVIRVA